MRHEGILLRFLDGTLKFFSPLITTIIIYINNLMCLSLLFLAMLTYQVIGLIL